MVEVLDIHQIAKMTKYKLDSCAIPHVLTQMRKELALSVGIDVQPEKLAAGLYALVRMKNASNTSWK